MATARAFLERSSSPRGRWRLVIGLGLLFSGVHALALPRLNLGEYTPDLFTLFALYVGLFASRHGRYWPSLVLGLVRDFFSMGLIGTYAVLYSLLHKFSGKLRGKLDPDFPPIGLLFGFTGVFLVNFGYHFMLSFGGDGVGWSVALWRCTATALVTAPFAIPVFPLLHWLLTSLGYQRTQGGYFNF